MVHAAAALADSIDAQLATTALIARTADEEQLSSARRDGLELGDGTVAATIEHVCGVYDRLAAFIAKSTGPRSAAGREPEGRRPGRHLGHAAPDRAPNREELVARVERTRVSISLVRALEAELGTTPPKGSFRFCDGRRTLGQVLEGVVRHQQHHVDALTVSSS